MRNQFFYLLSIPALSLTMTIRPRRCKICVPLNLRCDTQVSQRAMRKTSSSDHLSDSQLAFRCINMQATPKLRWMRGRARGVCSRSLFPQELWHEALIPQCERRVTALFTTRATSSAPSSLAWRWLCCRCLLFYHVLLSYPSLSTGLFPSSFSTHRNVWTGRPIVNVKINSPRPFQRSSSTRVLHGPRVRKHIHQLGGLYRTMESERAAWLSQPSRTPLPVVSHPLSHCVCGKLDHIPAECITTT